MSIDRKNSGNIFNNTFIINKAVIRVLLTNVLKQLGLPVRLNGNVFLIHKYYNYCICCKNTCLNFVNVSVYFIDYLAQK